MPEPVRPSGGLTATQLKYLAACFMVVDHVGMLLDPLAAWFGPTELPRYLLRYLGRLAFPIFAYFAAQGCRKTHDYRGYLLRLGAFGAVTHAVAFFATGGTDGSVVATFFLAALAIWLWRRLSAQRLAPLGALAVLGLLILAHLLRVDYGWVGVLTVLAVYACGEDRRRQLLALAACLLLYYAAGSLWTYWSPVLEALREGGALFQAELAARLPYFQRFYLPHTLLMTSCSLLTLPLLARYNGQRGNGNRWFFYWFYPGHLVALYALSMLLS
ncbi:MAG TPA: conjugal transfer protein TraX [Candidatus Intestinimonas pullistercoris]|uniref:Conjugal transfer protein TraX n=1 Tax=Candidatus Intestinimonas pullistercoris TaxID=2838623 RepID=A0A9D2SYX4_9FIRM|nr:TraX family protein [uncultured Intestinimonas sp.]HJC40918.1 conjugal transfer protein TraX [Candidatus Intestinimonas pullistercoris]